MKANYETPKVESLNMSLYDLNKQIVSQMPDYTEAHYEAVRPILDEYGKHKEWCLMLGREINYYTVFHNNPKDAEETFADAVISCCKHLGQVKSIDWDSEERKEVIEIWVMNGEHATVLYLFDYKEGVIECQM